MTTPPPETTAPSRKKLLPREEMTPEEVERYIDGNQVGFYGFQKNGKLYIRDVRNKELYRTEDRKLIPQGKDCTSYRMGDMAFIYLSLFRHLPEGHPSLFTPELQNRFQPMPRPEMERLLMSTEAFPQLKKNLPDGSLSSLTDEELRQVLMFTHLRKNTDGGTTISNLFHQFHLFRAP